MSLKKPIHMDREDKKKKDPRKENMRAWASALTVGVALYIPVLLLKILFANQSSSILVSLNKSLALTGALTILFSLLYLGLSGSFEKLAQYVATAKRGIFVGLSFALTHIILVSYFMGNYYDAEWLSDMSSSMSFGRLAVALFIFSFLFFSPPIAKRINKKKWYYLEIFFYLGIGAVILHALALSKPSFSNFKLWLKNPKSFSAAGTLKSISLVVSR